MSRGSIADRTRLAAFAARRALRTSMGRFNAHPLLRWRFTPAIADRLLIAPQDLRTADPTRASEIYSGRFAFAGKIVICDGRSPFEIEPPSEEWADQLLGFGWLRHLRAAESASRAPMRARWSTNGSRCKARSTSLDGWRPDLVARRIISWLSQAPLVLHEADMRFYRRFLRNLTRQVRYLRRTVNATRDGVPRLQAIVALTYAALCMQGAGAHAQERHAHARRRARPPGAARRRPRQPQSGRADRAAARSAAAAPGVRGAQRAAAGRAQQRDRPHDADAALLPPRRRQLRAVQRHGADAHRTGLDRARL